MFYFIYSWIKNNVEETNSQSIAFVISIVTSIILEIALSIWGYCNIKELFQSKKKYIEEHTKIELEKALNSDKDYKKN